MFMLNKRLVGAGAGPYPLRQKNAEGIYNMLLTPEGKLHNGSFMASIEGQDEQCTLRPIPDSEPRCAVLLNLFASRGEKGPVIKVSCKKRIGSLNFIECIRLGLQEHYRDKCIGKKRKISQSYLILNDLFSKDAL